MLNWLLRYQPVIELVNALETDDILDVGSGRHGLSWYANRSVVQTDLEFPRNEEDEGRAGTAHFVAARAEELPFCDDAFDVAISLDLVEHMPAKDRPAAIRELCRVSRRSVIIGFPVGRPARGLDRVLALYWRIRDRQGTPTWLQEHLAQTEYPSAGLVADSLPAGWSVAETRTSGNVWLQGMVVLAEWTPLVHRLMLRLERRARNRGPWTWLDRGKTYRTIWVLRPEASSGQA